jgi:hypothetical protein
MMTYNDLAAEVRQLSIQDRKRLIDEIIESLIQSNSSKNRSLLEFEGAGKRLYDGKDAQDYVNELRQEWDHRP